MNMNNNKEKCDTTNRKPWLEGTEFTLKGCAATLFPKRYTQEGIVRWLERNQDQQRNAYPSQCSHKWSLMFQLSMKLCRSITPSEEYDKMP